MRLLPDTSLGPYLFPLLRWVHPETRHWRDYLEGYLLPNKGILTLTLCEIARIPRLKHPKVDMVLWVLYMQAFQWTHVV
jgi:hypothetical protein